MCNKPFAFIRFAAIGGIFILYFGFSAFRTLPEPVPSGPARTATGLTLSGKGELIFEHPSKKYSIYYDVIFTTVDGLVIGQGKKVKEVRSNGKTIVYSRNPPAILGGLVESNYLEMTMEEEGFNKKVYETNIEFKLTGGAPQELTGTYSNDHGSGKVQLVMRKNK